MPPPPAAVGAAVAVRSLDGPADERLHLAAADAAVTLTPPPPGLARMENHP
jgi:hypothetical protein